MGFWVFMFVMILLIPLTMIGFGKMFLKNAQGDINAIFGYRSTMSMKNKETWEFAHKYCGKIWHVGGWILLVISVIPMLLVLGKDTDTVGLIGGILCMVQMLPLVGAIIPTEIALNKNFDKDGNRR